MADPAIRRTCVDCGELFDITEDERAFLGNVSAQTGRAFVLPRRCLTCRRARRRDTYETPVIDDGRDEHLVCGDCGVTFVFGGRDRAYFARRGWVTPKRCRDCRQQRASQ